MSISLYIAIYYNLLLLLIVCLVIQPIEAKTVKRPYFNNPILSMFVLLIVFVHITFRPTDYHYFGDTFAYARDFQEKVLLGYDAIKEKDIGFQYLTYILSQFFSLEGYWFVLCCIYIFPVFYAFKRHFKQQYSVALVFFVCSFSFWSYGVNGLRNGLATSVLILSFLVPKSELARIPFWIIAYSFHQSSLLPILCFILAKIWKNSRHYLVLWGITLVLVLVFQGTISNFLLSIPWLAQDDRMSTYLTMSYTETGANFSNTGFRWDFVLYSLVPIFIGYKYIYRYRYENKIYIRLYNTYVIANTFWLLTIYAPYNNRFAYLSWFLYPIVFIYPLLKEDLIRNQGERIKWIILGYYMFTYVMWIR